MNASSNDRDNQQQTAVPLNDCPTSPNCVCSVASRPDQSMPAIKYQCSDEQIIEHAIACLQSFPRVEIVSQKSNYVHAIFRSRIFRFADDVEFFADTTNHQLHFRSASRIGYSDLGANRKRMEQCSQRIRESLAKRDDKRGS